MIQLPRLLDSSGAEVRRIRPVRVSITEKIVPISTANMIILKEDMIPDRSYVKLFTANGVSGVYRARTPEVGYGDVNVTIGLEHAVCEVGDWLVRNSGDQEKKTLSNALNHFFSYYGGNKWQLGTVSVTGDVVVQDQYQNILNAMNSAISQIPSAMMTFNFSTSPWTINIVNRGSTVAAEGRLSRNIESARVKKDDSQLYTRVWLEGLGSNGAIDKMDADTMSTYGVIETHLSSSDYTQEQAQTVASNYLAKHKRPQISVTISAVDLSKITGVSLDQFTIGELFRLAIPDEGVTVEENIICIQWDDVYGKPGSCKITLAEEAETVVKFLQQKQSETNSSISGLTNEYKGYAADTDAKIGDIEDDLGEQQEDLELIWTKTGIDDLGQDETLMTKITANASGIETLVSKTGINSLGQQETLYSKIDQQAGQIALVVTQENGHDVVNAASIVLGINNQDTTAQSFVTIQADMIDIQGVVSATEARITDLEAGDTIAYMLRSQWAVVETLDITSDLFMGGQNHHFVPTVVSIGGTTYTILAHT